MRFIIYHFSKGRFICPIFISPFIYSVYCVIVLRLSMPMVYDHSLSVQYVCYYGLSTHIAMPIPPPIHNAATPLLACLFLRAYNSVTNIRAPDAPIGWPKAIAPPLTLTCNTNWKETNYYAKSKKSVFPLSFSEKSENPLLLHFILDYAARLLLHGALWVMGNLQISHMRVFGILNIKFHYNSGGIQGFMTNLFKMNHDFTSHWFEAGTVGLWFWLKG